MSHDTTPIPPVSRRRFLSQAGVAMAAAMTPGVIGQLPASAGYTHTARAERPRRRPNVVLIVADDLGWNEVGAYGQQLIQTPTLDRLAAEGVRYTDFYSGGPVCAPARCTLLTGMHTGHCTVRNNPEPGQGDEPFAEDEVTIGHVLQSVGYRTALFGKWGFSPDQPGHHSHPNAQGFDEFFGYLTHQHAHSYYPTHLWHNDQRVELPENAGGARVTYAPDLFTDRCLDFVRQHRDEPFMMFWSTNIPHFPQQVPDLGPYADTSWGAGEKAHAAQITRLDADIDRLVATLTELGIADDTIVLFCGDNGPHEEGAPSLDPDFFQASSPFRGYKRNLLEGGIRVPAIVWAPGLQRRSAGTVSDHPWAMWDVLPTLADLAGAPVPPYVDGLSMRGVVTGESAAPEHEFLYWWRLEPFSSRRAAAAENGRVQQAAEAVRQDSWKALRYAPGRLRDVPDDQWQFELYDLATDQAERNDVAAAHPDVAAAMLALMHAGWAEPPYDRVSWSPEGVAVHAPHEMAAGREGVVTVEFTNHHDRLPATRIGLDLVLPDGWTATPPDRSPAVVVRPGESTAVSFVVTPGGQGSTAVSLTAVARFRRGPELGTAEVTRPVAMLPAPPSVTSYVSDLEWLSASNGWGPVERDMSNGRNQASDGPPIALAGRVYEKGLGVHAPSEVVFYLGGGCDRFTSDIGIDDFSANQSGNGSVVFEVWADDVRVYGSGLVTAATGPRSVDVSVAGAERLRLVVTDAGNGNTHDHSSWADATVHVSG